MKTLKLIALMLLWSAVAGVAIGPKIPHLLYWTDSNPSGSVTGCLLYVRTPSGAYIDALRTAISTNQPCDLSVLGYAKGQYYLTISFTNLTSESVVADEILWDYRNPNKPTNLYITP